MIRNPATALAQLLGRLHTAEGVVAVPDFYAGVEPLPAPERVWLAAAEPTAKELLRASGSPSLWGERTYSPIERVWNRPTAEINSIHSGFAGERFQMVVPAKAEARLSFRLVAGQKASDVATRVRQWVDANRPDGVRVTCDVKPGGDPFTLDVASAAAQAARRALAQTFGRSPALVRSGVTIRILTELRQSLGADPLLLGLSAPDANVHGANENLRLELFSAGIKLHQHLLSELAALSNC